MTLLRSLERLLFLSGVLFATSVVNYCREPSSDYVPSGPSNKAFEMARKESLGYFDDIPEHLWTRRKQFTGKHVHNGNNGDNDHTVKYSRNPPAWYQTNWDPDFSCFNEENVGGEGVLDGHGWVCDPQRLNKKECLVYSFQTNATGELTFEMDLQAWAPLCEIHVFDPFKQREEIQMDAFRKAFFHPWGIKPSYETPTNNIQNPRFNQGTQPVEKSKTLEDTMRELGHEGRTINVFKIDCKGCEWVTYKDFLKFDLRQILIEVNEYVPLTDNFFWDLHDAGYVMFHKWSIRGRTLHFSFLKLAKSFFEPDKAESSG